MKKLLTLLLLLSTMAAQAQTGKAADQVAKIRARYAEAKQMMANEGEDWMTQNHVVVNATYMCPGTGPRNENIQFYFTLDEGDEDSDEIYVRTPYLITRSYNVAPRKFYEEYLYDAKGHLIFFYSSNDSHESELKDESRYYWNASAKLVHQQKQGEALYSEAHARSISDHLLQTFHMLVIP